VVDRQARGSSRGDRRDRAGIPPGARAPHCDPDPVAADVLLHGSDRWTTFC